MFMIIEELFITILLIQVREHISQSSNLAFSSTVPAHNSFLSIERAIQEISGEQDYSD